MAHKKSKKKSIRLCPECYYDYKAGGIVFNDKNVIVKKVKSVEECEY